VAEQLAEHHFWFSVQPEFGACCVAQQFEKLDFWSTFQAEFGERQVAQQFAVADVPQWLWQQLVCQTQEVE